jgi:hypothetical protein
MATLIHTPALMFPPTSATSLARFPKSTLQTDSYLSALRPSSPFSEPRAERTAEYGVRLTKRRALSVLYRYEPGVPIEYPESGVDAHVGHLIPVDPAAARLP